MKSKAGEELLEKVRADLKKQGAAPGLADKALDAGNDLPDGMLETMSAALHAVQSKEEKKKQPGEKE